MAFYSYFSTKIIMAFITKSYQNLFGVRSYINAIFYPLLTGNFSAKRISIKRARLIRKDL